MEIVCIEFFGEVKVYLVIMLCHFIYETPSGGVGIYIDIIICELLSRCFSVDKVWVLYGYNVEIVVVYGVSR